MCDILPAGGRPRVPVTRHENQRHMKNHSDQHPLCLMGTEDFIEMQTKIKEHAEASCWFYFSSRQQTTTKSYRTGSTVHAIYQRRHDWCFMFELWCYCSMQHVTCIESFSHTKPFILVYQIVDQFSHQAIPLFHLWIYTKISKCHIFPGVF